MDDSANIAEPARIAKTEREPEILGMSSARALPRKATPSKYLHNGLIGGRAPIECWSVRIYKALPLLNIVVLKHPMVFPGEGALFVFCQLFVSHRFVS